MKSVLKGTTIGAGLLAAAAIAYRGRTHGRPRHWGATRDEWAGELPGDDVVQDPNHQSTRAIEIEATPAEVWPWLVQMGQGRGGAYSYERLQNLFRLDFHNADRILPEFQDLKVGDTIPLDPSGKGPKVRELVSEQFMLLEDTKPPWTWMFTLHPTSAGGTRLVVRNRVSTRGTSLALRVFYRVIGTLVFFMERKMLLGIKERAERPHSVSEIGLSEAAPVP